MWVIMLSLVGIRHIVVASLLSVTHAGSERLINGSQVGGDFVGYPQILQSKDSVKLYDRQTFRLVRVFNPPTCHYPAYTVHCFNFTHKSCRVRDDSKKMFSGHFRVSGFRSRLEAPTTHAHTLISLYKAEST